jgi:hypothetical protein
LLDRAANQVDEAVGRLLSLSGVGHGIRFALDGSVEAVGRRFGSTTRFLLAATLLLGLTLALGFLFLAATLLLGFTLALGFLFLAATLLLGLTLALGFLFLAATLLLGFTLALGLFLLAATLFLGLTLALGLLFLAATLLLGFLLAARLLFGTLLGLELTLAFSLRRGFLLALPLGFLLFTQASLALGFLSAALGFSLGFFPGLLQAACFLFTRRLFLFGLLLLGLALSLCPGLLLGFGLPCLLFLASLLLGLARGGTCTCLLGPLSLIGRGLGAHQGRLYDGVGQGLIRLALGQGHQTEHHDQHVQANCQQRGQAVADRPAVPGC